MANGNNNLLKTVLSGGAAAIIGVLFYIFLTAHFDYLNNQASKLDDALDANTKALQGVISSSREVKNGMENLQEDLKQYFWWNKDAVDVSRNDAPLELTKP